MIEGEALTEAELKKFQEFFNQKENYAYTLPRYRTPDKIDIDGVTVDDDSAKIVCKEGVRKGNFVQVVVSYPDSKRYDRRISLIETNNSKSPYEFYSCRQYWENEIDKVIEAPIYGTDEKVTCGVITKYDNYTTEIVIIDDNAVSGTVLLSPYIGERENVASDEVKEIAFCDINNNGVNDMIAICVYGDETRAICCGGTRIKKRSSSIKSDAGVGEGKNDGTTVYEILFKGVLSPYYIEQYAHHKGE